MGWKIGHIKVLYFGLINLQYKEVQFREMRSLITFFYLPYMRSPKCLYQKLKNKISPLDLKQLCKTFWPFWPIWLVSAPDSKRIWTTVGNIYSTARIKAESSPSGVEFGSAPFPVSSETISIICSSNMVLLMYCPTDLINRTSGVFPSESVILTDAAAFNRMNTVSFLIPTVI